MFCLAQGDLADEMYIVTEGKLQAWQSRTHASVLAHCIWKGVEFWTTVRTPDNEHGTVSLDVAWDDERVQHRVLIDADKYVVGTIHLPPGYDLNSKPAFFTNFDTAIGISQPDVATDDRVNVIEVRRGYVMGYLGIRRLLCHPFTELGLVTPVYSGNPGLNR